MLKQLRSLAKSTAIYSLGNVSSKLVGFILLPFFTNEAYLTVQAYGVLGLFEAIVQLFVALFGMGIYNGIFRFYYEEEEKQGRLIFTSQMLVVALGICGIIIGITGEPLLSKLIFKDIPYLHEYRNAYHWMLLAAALQLIGLIPITLMRLKNDAKLYTITSILMLLVTLVATIVLLTVYKQGLVAIYKAQAAGQLLFLVLVLPYLIKHSAFKFDWRVPTTMLSYSFPIMLSTIVAILVQFADRFIINSINGLTEVGVYSLAVKLSNFIKVFVIGTFTLSLTPLLFKKIHDPDHKRFYQKSMTYYGFIILLAIMFVSLFSYEIIKAFTRTQVYHEAFLIIPILSLSLYFVAIKSVGIIGIHISKKMWYLTVLTGLILTINIALNLVLIPKLGTMGAAVSTLISQLLYFWAGYFISQKLYHIPFEWRKIIVMPILASILIYLGILFNPITLFVRIPIKLFVIALFPILLYFGGFYEEIEKKRIYGAFKKWRNPSQFWSNLKQFFE